MSTENRPAWAKKTDLPMVKIINGMTFNLRASGNGDKRRYGYASELQEEFAIKVRYPDNVIEDDRFKRPVIELWQCVNTKGAWYAVFRFHGAPDNTHEITTVRAKSPEEAFASIPGRLALARGAEITKHEKAVATFPATLTAIDVARDQLVTLGLPRVEWADKTTSPSVP